MTVQTAQHWIDGQRVGSARTSTTIDPATGEVIGTYADADAEVGAGGHRRRSWANLTIEFEEGGFKASGVGRLGGLASIEDFLEYKQIVQNYTP